MKIKAHKNPKNKKYFNTTCILTTVQRTTLLKLKLEYTMRYKQEFSLREIPGLVIEDYAKILDSRKKLAANMRTAKNGKK